MTSKHNKNATAKYSNFNSPIQSLKRYKKHLIATLWTLLTVLAAICWPEYYIYIVISGLIIVVISLIYDKEWVAEHPIISFIVVFSLVSTASLVAAKFWTGSSSQELYSLNENTAHRTLQDFGQYFSGTIGSAIALAGAFVGIFLGATAFFLSKREQHREEMIHLVEKTGPAIKQAVKLIELIHAQTEIFNSIKNINEAKNFSDIFVGKLEEFFPKDPGEKDLWFAFLLYNVDVTKIWYKQLLNISKLGSSEIQNEVKVNADIITLEPRCENYEAIVRLLEKSPPIDSLIDMLEKYKPMVHSLHQGAWFYFMEDLIELSSDIEFNDDFEQTTFDLSALIKDVFKENTVNLLEIVHSDSTRVKKILDYQKKNAENNQDILKEIENNPDVYILRGLEDALQAGVFEGGFKNNFIKWFVNNNGPQDLTADGIKVILREAAIANWDAEYLNAVIPQAKKK